MHYEVPCVIMYLSVHDSDRKRAFTLAGRHNLKGGTMQVQLKKGVMDMLVEAFDHLIAYVGHYLVPYHLEASFGFDHFGTYVDHY